MALAYSKKAQASIADSMFILVICAAISVLLFTVSMNHGKNVERQLQYMHSTEYATSALQTILYSSFSYDEHASLEESKEVDYLLVQIKTDYVHDGVLSDKTKAAVARLVEKVMSPFEHSYDYVFYIWAKPDQKIEGISAGELGFILFYLKATEGTESKRYFCSPKLPKSKIFDEVLLGGVGGPSVSSPVAIALKRWLPPESHGPGYATIQSYAGIVMWPITKLPPGPDGENILGPTNLNCTEFAFS